MPRKQLHRFLRLKSPLSDDVLLIKRMTGVERLGRPFVYTLDLFSEDPEIGFDKVVGQPVTIHVDTSRTTTRYFNGFISSFEQVEADQRKAVYRAVVVPWLWFLTRTADCRIFQKMTVPEIIKDVFDRFPISNFDLAGLTGDYEKLTYCVQYRETAFNFVHRLMEEEGIYYYFKHQDGTHQLMMCDSPAAHSSAEGYDMVTYNPESRTKVDTQSIWHWKLTQLVQPGKYVHTDYDFFKPSTSLESNHEIPRPHAASKLEFYDYPGRYYEQGVGTRLAHVRLEEFHAEHEVVHGEGDSRGLEAGHTFSLHKHPRQDQIKEHLLTSVEYMFTADDYESESAPEVKVVVGSRAATSIGATHGVQAGHGGGLGGGGAGAGSIGPGAAGGNGAGGSLGMGGGSSDPGPRKHDKPPQCICRFTAIDKITQFRPLRITHKPFVQGPQTATVVGPGGEEIHTDEFGRVKVHFHWDRHHARTAEDSSCWIRVSQAWAGGGWGAIYTPRIGQEVVVDFIEGDPDRPLITGRVYNKEKPVPYSLPANKTVSTLKSRSSKGGSASNFNELKFEDKKGSELMYVQAEKNRTMLVKNDNHETIGHDETVHVCHDRAKTIDNNETTIVGVDRTETVGSNETITIGANRAEQVGANETVTIGGMRSHTTALASAETVGLAKALSIGAAYQVSVGAMMNETVVGAKMEEAGLYRLIVVGGDMDHKVVGTDTIKAKEIVLEAEKKILIKCGGSQIVLEPGLITITSTLVKLNC